MGSSPRALAFALVLAMAISAANGQLSEKFYGKTCPRVQDIVRNAMSKAAAQDRRAPASMLRMHFHDCFVQGCDGSLLLDGAAGEKNAIPNLNLRRFDLIDDIKALVEAACPGVVSCADVLALAALEGVATTGGPRWKLGLGRRDTRTAASINVTNFSIPPSFFNLSQLISSLADKGLDATDLTALSGAHTIGQAECISFRDHVYNDTNIDPEFAATRRAVCPRNAPNGNTNLAPLDRVSPTRFDNNYFKNLLARKGLMHSDQELFNGGSQDALVRRYATNQAAFFRDFARGMTKMSGFTPLTGTAGEIRRNCRVPN